MATKRASSKKINFEKNFKTASSKKEVMKDVWGLLAGLTWLLPASFLKLDGWGGFALASVGTWLTGALFNIEAMRRSALAIGAVHLLYSKGSKTIQDNLKVDLWRMGGEFTDVTLATNGTTTPPTGSLRGLSNNMQVQQGSEQVMALPSAGVDNLIRRPAEVPTMESMQRALPPIPTITPSVPVSNTDSMMGLNGLSGYKANNGEQIGELQMLPTKGLSRGESINNIKNTVELLPVRASA